MKRLVSLSLLVISAVFVLLLSGCDFVSGVLGNVGHEHSFTEENTEDAYLASAADCTNAAVYYFSCECGEKSEETFAFGDPIGHSYGEGRIIAPTCTAAGYTEYTCHCGYVKTSEEVAASGHNYIAGKVTAPGCTTVGYTEYNCHCGDVKIADEVAASGHDYKIGKVTDPGCTTVGYTEYNCHCGDVKI